MKWVRFRDDLLAPLCLQLSGANGHDTKMSSSVLNALPSLGGASGRPRKRLYKLYADKSADLLPAENVDERNGRREIEFSERVGHHHWVVEQTFSLAEAFIITNADAYLAQSFSGCSATALRFYSWL